MPSRSERGTTLVELLAATIILGVISFALTSAIVSGFRNTGESEEKLVGSLDRQRLADAFVADAQSAQSQDRAPENICGPAPEQLLINLQWSDDEMQYTASYVTEIVKGRDKLVRRYCIQHLDVPVDDDVLADITETADFCREPTTPPDPPCDDEDNGELHIIFCRVQSEDECTDEDFRVTASPRAATGTP